MSIEDNVWDRLLKQIVDGNCLPIIGPDASEPWISIKKITQKLAIDQQYPLSNHEFQLPYIAQYIEMHQSFYFLTDVLRKEFDNMQVPNFASKEYVDSPYRVLADLHLPIYITTNYDLLMETALKQRGKEPVTEFFVWNEDLRKYVKDTGIPSVFPDVFYGSPSKKKTANSYTPTQGKPLVYHLCGAFSTPESLVLRESDFIDFIIYLHTEENSEILPQPVFRALNKNLLLFVGHSFGDTSFRFIFQGLMKKYSKGLRSGGTNVCVQLPLSHLNDNNERELAENPSLNISNKEELAESYFKKYSEKKFEISLYYEDLNEFSKELGSKLRILRGNQNQDMIRS